MTECPDCSTKLASGSRFCPRCGKPIFAPTTVPRAASGGGAPASASEAGRGVAPSIGATVVMERMPDTDETLFAPGALLAGRYRIIACLGKGGMGEVYRADDLKLGQPVALKFLPRSFASDQRRLERFREEVRISRQVAHPNVCRVYDLDDMEAETGQTQHFLSMEYIDGEDLSSLLRRIGRLPKDKAVQVARQICAGLAAAHTAGVLHRDLKPANIMLDGRGQAKIMDFGIAGAIGGIKGSDVRSGTPAYMAPESLAGREVSPRSDIYSLGLVLYELFTGRRAFEGDTLTTATSTRTATAVSRPSTLIDDMDPAVERVIMRCLDDEPANRPSSAISVAAALPGGDPLLAALQAGETPSPELVAAAGPKGTLKPAWAAGMLAFCVACVVFLMWGSSKTEALSHVPLERSPAVLEDRAKEMLRALGHDEAGMDEASFIRFRREFLGYLQAQRASDPKRWEVLRGGRPAVVRYTYRSSPTELAPLGASGVVRPNDPANTEPGMRLIELDTTGRLTGLSVVPPEKKAVSGDAAPIPRGAGEGAAREALIGRLFESAGLDVSQFAPAEPTRRSPHEADEHLAWIGVLPDDAGLKWRVEAAFVEGKPVWFRQFGPWELNDEPGAGAGDPPGSGQPESEPPAESKGPPVKAIKPGTLSPRGPDAPAKPDAGGPVVVRMLQASVLLIVIAGLLFAAHLARRNYRLGRGDVVGASRLAGAIVVMRLVIWACTAHHVPSLASEWQRFMIGLGLSLLPAAIAWMLYMALEPIVRRRDPRMLVSWTRLLSGRWRDPLVGRHILLASVFGTGITAATLAYALIPPMQGRPAAVLFLPNELSLAGAAGAIAYLLTALLQAVINGLLVLFFYVGVSVLFKVRALAIGALFLFAALLLLADGGATSFPEPGLVAMLLVIAGGLTFFIVRFGLLAIIATHFVFLVFRGLPMGMDLSAWHARGTIAGLLLFAALLAFGYISAVARWPSQSRVVE